MPSLPVFDAPGEAAGPFGTAGANELGAVTGLRGGLSEGDTIRPRGVGGYCGRRVQRIFRTGNGLPSAPSASKKMLDTVRLPHHAAMGCERSLLPPELGRIVWFPWHSQHGRWDGITGPMG